MQLRHKEIPGTVNCLLMIISYCAIIVPSDKWTRVMLENILAGLISIGNGNIFGFLYSLIAFMGIIYLLQNIALKKTDNSRRKVLTGILLLCIHRLAYFVLSDYVALYFGHLVQMIPEMAFWSSVIFALIVMFRRNMSEAKA